MPTDLTLLYSLALGLVIAGVIIFFWSFRSVFAQLFRRATERPAPRPPADTRSNLSSVMEDAEELSQLIADRLDRQAARLEQLIVAADDRLTRLQQATTQTLQIQPPPAPTPPPPPRPTIDPLSQQVYTLSDRGLPPVEIARQLSQHTGKVELILALRQR